jgi:hypothetical protein
VAPHITSLSQTSAPEGSDDLTITIRGSNFSVNSTALVDGLTPLVTTFVSPNNITAIIPADLLAEEGSFTISVLDSQIGASNAKTFHVVESVPQIDASVVQGLTFQDFTVSGLVTDLAQEDHQVRVNWGDGTVQTISVNPDGSFSVDHTFAQPGHVHHDSIVVTPLDDEGFAGEPLVFDVIV